MGDVLVDLLPLLIGAALLPVWIIIVLFLLRGERGPGKAAAFLGGAMLVRLAQGVIFGLLIETAVQEYGEESANAIASTLLLIVGILLLLGAVKKWRREEDPDAP
ncbi:MAG: GAP family protein, partial [Caldilineaceae bacterium]